MTETEPEAAACINVAYPPPGTPIVVCPHPDGPHHPGCPAVAGDA